MPQHVAKINLCDSKLQEPFVTLYPLNKLSFCSALECVQLNRCTSSKMNVVAYRVGKGDVFLAVFDKGRLGELAMHLGEIKI